MVALKILSENNSQQYSSQDKYYSYFDAYDLFSFIKIINSKMLGVDS